MTQFGLDVYYAVLFTIGNLNRNLFKNQGQGRPAYNRRLVLTRFSAPGARECAETRRRFLAGITFKRFLYTYSRVRYC